MRPPAFLDDAACKGMDTEIFFPHYFRHGAYKEARRICATCPVIRECLQFALDTEATEGMYGGMTPKQRERIAANGGVIGVIAIGHGDKPGTEAGYQRELRAGLEPCDACRSAVSAAVIRRRDEKREAIA